MFVQAIPFAKYRNFLDNGKISVAGPEQQIIN
jgi:hypothetical protein